MILKEVFIIYVQSRSSRNCIFLLSVFQFCDKIFQSDCFLESTLYNNCLLFYQSNNYWINTDKETVWDKECIFMVKLELNKFSYFSPNIRAPCLLCSCFVIFFRLFILFITLVFTTFREDKLTKDVACSYMYFLAYTRIHVLLKSKTDIIFSSFPTSGFEFNVEGIRIMEKQVNFVVSCNKYSF